MFFIADENVDSEVVAALRERHKVIYICEERTGITDEEILDLCNQMEAILVTADKDFGDLVFRRRLAHKGVVLIRLPGLTVTRKSNLVQSVVARHIDEMAGNFTVIMENAVRIKRPFPP